jgi:dTDP-4-amino-4,6-dideoxygalactose transaminase
MIRVLIPSMPTADELLPFLREIDERKVYVNGGPLVRRLEVKIAALTKAPCTVVANGTVSLELALRAMNLPQGCGVLVPAVTYVASAQAIVNAGLVPVICDVDPDTWQLDADDAFLITQHQPKIRAVMPVATFGEPVPIEPWEKFTYETNLPVLIDAAGAIADQESSPIPEIVLSFSLHATKAIGCGEGGAVVTADRTLLVLVESLANFGIGGTNAKMSEYHAAVGLASLERSGNDAVWMSRLAAQYGEQLPEGLTFTLPCGLGARICPVLLPPGRDAAAIGENLLSKGIETRQWYRPFLDEREFAHCPMQPTRPVTEYLRRRCLGLPWHEFLTEDDVHTVCTALAEAIA